jgi:hypothetical protein
MPKPGARRVGFRLLPKRQACPPDFRRHNDQHQAAKFVAGEQLEKLVLERAGLTYNPPGFIDFW